MSFKVRMKKDVWSRAASQLAGHRHNGAKEVIVELTLKNRHGEKHSFLGILYESNENMIQFGGITVKKQPREIAKLETPPPSSQNCTPGQSFWYLMEIKPTVITDLRIYSVYEILWKLASDSTLVSWS